MAWTPFIFVWLSGVNAFIQHTIGERFWESEEPFPSQVQIFIDLNPFGIVQAGELRKPCVFFCEFRPSLDQIIKGANSGNTRATRIFVEHEEEESCHHLRWFKQFPT